MDQSKPARREFQPRCLILGADGGHRHAATYLCLGPILVRLGHTSLHVAIVWKRVHGKPPSRTPCAAVPTPDPARACPLGLYGLMKNASNARSSVIGGAFA